MSNSFDSLFRIIKNPRKKEPIFPNKITDNILVQKKKTNIFFQRFKRISKRQKYFELTTLLLSIIAYALYYLSLGGCDGTQTECLKNSNIAYYYMLVNYCFLSAGIIAFIFFLIKLKLVSKIHLVHIFIILPILFLSDTGATLMNHGIYNIIGFTIFFFFYIIFIFLVITIQDLITNKTLLKKLLVINSVIIVIVICRFLMHNSLKKECKDWDLGLNNTRILDDINEYPCQINRPISCHLNYLNNKQDLSKLLKLQCSNNINSNQVINSRNLLIKYINRKEIEKTKRFGFPLTNTIKFKIDSSLTPDSFTQKVFDNIIDMDNPPIDLSPEEYPEVTLNFGEFGDDYKEGDKSMKYMGKININLTRNEKLANERKKKETNISLFNNIIMIYTDSVSRAHFLRKMPKTCSFIEKFMKNNFDNDYNNVNNLTSINNGINNSYSLTNSKKASNISQKKIRNLDIKKTKRHKNKKRFKKKVKLEKEMDENISSIRENDLNSNKQKVNIREFKKNKRFKIIDNITLFSKKVKTKKKLNKKGTEVNLNNKRHNYQKRHKKKVKKTLIVNKISNSFNGSLQNGTNLKSKNEENISEQNNMSLIDNKNNSRRITNAINDKYYAYQFFKYHTFTSGTKFNVMPMFFGKSVYSIEATNLIKYFKELGFITAQSVDMCSKEVWEPEKEPPNIDFDFWDHENVAMFCDPSYMDRKSLYSIYKGVYSLLRRCFYGKEVHDYIFEYGTKFWEAYPDNKKFLRLAFNDGHESTFEVLQYLDEPLYNFLNTFYQKGYLKNTALIFVSDHGNHMPGLYNLLFSDQYETERLLGSFYIIINSDYLFNEGKEKFKNFNQNIMKNQQSLLTPYDIHDTLVHILYGDNNTGLYSSKGKSVFMNINNSKRDCNYFDQDFEEKGLCRCVPNEKYEKFIYYNNVDNKK